jgi:hypothetical protein
MKQTLISASIFAMLSTGAIAGNIATPIADADINIPTSTVTDWSGGYVGFSYSSVDGTHQYKSGSWTDPHDFLDQSALGGQFGYNWQRSNLVYGVEVKFIQGFDGVIGHVDDKLGNIIDPRFRVGYAPENSNVLYFVHVGQSMADYYDSNLTTTTDVSGASYGVGSEMMINNNMSAGLNISHHDLDNSTKRNSVNLISVFVNYHFN